MQEACADWLAAHSADGPLVVACSGGADSVALTHGVLAAAGGRPVIGATVDHGLQPGSADRARACAGLLLRLGCVEARVLTVTLGAGGGPEAAARRARYGALTSVSEALDDAPVLLGHTADDQAETVLLGLARGSGPRSIAGMRPWRAPWGRPLLAVSRRDTEAACRQAGLATWQDPHNTDPTFTRVRLRREVLPLLEDVLGGGVRDALVRTADLMSDDLAALDRIAADALDRARDGDALSAEAVVGQPSAVRRRVLRRWLAGAGAGPLTHDHLIRLDRQLTDSAGPVQVRLPGGLDVWRRGAFLRVERPPGVVVTRS
ncbi:MAG TPA: tRNA lysidine(34) synthetase TilS [Nakamurella sp.]